MTNNPQTQEAFSIPSQKEQVGPIRNIMVAGFKKFVIERIIWFRLFLLAMRCYNSPQRAIKALLGLEKLRRAYMGEHPLMRIVKTGPQYSWHPNIPAWPSKAFNTFHEIEFNRIDPFRKADGDLTLLILSITKKCPLNCEHCFEWDIMHKREVLSLEDLKNIVKNQQDLGLAALELSGGEPLSRFNDLIILIKFASPKSEVWVLSSGFGLTANKASKLKEAGLTGVTISLDHFDAAKHNAFRGNGKSFYWVMEGIKNVKDAGLIPCLSVCATQTFATRENLMKYTELAKSLGVGFVQILEPKAKGKYAGLEIFLSDEQIDMITEFQRSLNSRKKYKDYPIIIYHGYSQRRMGCLGGGNRYKYIDSNGDIYPCPFCNSPMGNVLNPNNDAVKQEPICGPFEFSKT